MRVLISPRLAELWEESYGELYRDLLEWMRDRLGRNPLKNARQIQIVPFAPSWSRYFGIEHNGRRFRFTVTFFVDEDQQVVEVLSLVQSDDDES